MSLKQKIKEMAEISHGKTQSFNDKQERQAVKTFLAQNREFQAFWSDYFGTPKNTILLDDPLGKFKVDLGLVNYQPDKFTATLFIHGLIEVDVFNSWGKTFPSHYTKFHVLERKLKYFQGTDYKYLHCTFNNDHTQMVCTTRENIELCLEKFGVEKKWMSKINEYDKVVRCPLESNEVKWFNLSCIQHS